MDPIVALLPLLRCLANKVRLPAGCILSPEDLVQEAFIVLVRVMPRCRPTDYPRGRQTFIVERAFGAMRSAVRRAEHSRSTRYQHIKMPEEERAAPAEDLDLQLTVREVADGLSALDAAIVRHWTEGRRHWSKGSSADDIGRELGLSAAQVYYAMRRLKERIRVRLQGAVA